MARGRWLLVALLSLAWVSEARAQVFINPYGYYSGYGVRRGIHFRHRRHHLRVAGFFGSTYTAGSFGLGLYGPIAFYGPGFSSVTYYNPGPALGVTNNFIYQAAPTIMMNGAGRERPDEDDVSGIDLDTTDPLTLKPRRPVPEKMEAPQVVQRPQAKKKERLVPRAEKKPGVVPRPQLPLRLIREKPPEKDADPVELGQEDFAAREYAAAAQRFRQAALASPREFMPHFLLAQAQFALGKYRDAVHAIHAGMDLNKDWPGEEFPPRRMYKGNEVDFLGHLKRLEELLEKHPNDSVLLFMLAYELWFDGQREKARPLFRKAKQFAPKPDYCDQFLKA
jgi:hypothetical protein